MFRLILHDMRWYAHVIQNCIYTKRTSGCTIWKNAIKRIMKRYDEFLFHFAALLSRVQANISNASSPDWLNSAQRKEYKKVYKAEILLKKNLIFKYTTNFFSEKLLSIAQHDYPLIEKFHQPFTHCKKNLPFTRSTIISDPREPLEIIQISHGPHVPVPLLKITIHQAAILLEYLLSLKASIVYISKSSRHRFFFIFAIHTHTATPENWNLSPPLGETRRRESTCV